MNDIVTAEPETPDGPGVWLGIDNEVYHSSPGISKSGLWLLHTKTPAHFRYPPERVVKPHLELGSAIDIAILEPEKFETKNIRGPADRKGKKWTDAEAGVGTGQHLLVARDYDACLRVRDSIMSSPRLNAILTGGADGDTNLTQPSAYWKDERTGLLCRCRPDKVRTDIKIMLDLKSARDASKIGFSRACAEYGYHCQEGWYTEGWVAAGEEPIEGMLFLAVEKESPFAWGLYELEPSAIAEGNAIMRQALNTYSDCMKTDQWPAYSEEVEGIDIPSWAYKMTAAPRFERG